MSVCQLLGGHYEYMHTVFFIKRAIHRRKMCGDGYSMAIMSDHRSTDVTQSRDLRFFDQKQNFRLYQVQQKAWQNLRPPSLLWAALQRSQWSRPSFEVMEIIDDPPAWVGGWDHCDHCSAAQEHGETLRFIASSQLGKESYTCIALYLYAVY